MKARTYHLNGHTRDTARESGRLLSYLATARTSATTHTNQHINNTLFQREIPQQCTNFSSSAKSPQPATTRSSTSSPASQAPSPSPTKTRPLFSPNYAFQRSTLVPKGSQRPELPNHKNGSTNSHGQCKSLPAHQKAPASGDSASSKRQIPA